MSEQLPSEQLLPCPWCNGTDIRLFVADGKKYAQCFGCTSCGPDHVNGRHWNIRNNRADTAKWLRDRAEKQERINAEYPDHAKAYETWRDAPIQLRKYANEVESGQ